MPAPQIQPEHAAASDEARSVEMRPDHVHADLQDCAPVAAEPHRMQGEIVSRWSGPAPANDRWTLRQTAAFCLVTCGTFWAVSIYGVLHLVG